VIADVCDRWSSEPAGHSQGVPEGATDAVENALADALEAATAAGQWTLVAQLAPELEARRTARAGVVELDAERKRRGGR
jgi:hypothetical protein